MERLSVDEKILESLKIQDELEALRNAAKAFSEARRAVKRILDQPLQNLIAGGIAHAAGFAGNATFEITLEGAVTVVVESAVSAATPTGPVEPTLAPVVAALQPEKLPAVEDLRARAAKAGLSIDDVCVPGKRPTNNAKAAALARIVAAEKAPDARA